MNQEDLWLWEKALRSISKYLLMLVDLIEVTNTDTFKCNLKTKLLILTLRSQSYKYFILLYSFIVLLFFYFLALWLLLFLWISLCFFYVFVLICGIFWFGMSYYFFKNLLTTWKRNDSNPKHGSRVFQPQTFIKNMRKWLQRCHLC